MENDQMNTSGSLHERTVAGMEQVLEHALGHVEGLEKVIVQRAIQVLQPRVTQRIRIASEAELQSELEYLHKILDDILNISRNKSDKPKRKRKLKQ